MLHFANLSCSHLQFSWSFPSASLFHTLSSLLNWPTLPFLFTPSTVLNIFLYIFVICIFLLSFLPLMFSFLIKFTSIYLLLCIKFLAFLSFQLHFSTHCILCVSGKFICLSVLHFSIVNLDTVVWLKILTPYWGKNLGDPEWLLELSANFCHKRGKRTPSISRQNYDEIWGSK
jgi:hypothetical protein